APAATTPGTDRAAARIDVPRLCARIEGGYRISRQEARALVEADLADLLAGANRLRAFFRGDVVEFCSIVNAKSGRCEQDCGFCAQSAHHETTAPKYDFVGAETIVSAYHDAANRGAHRFGIIMAGGKTREELQAEVRRVVTAHQHDRKTTWCASLGMLERDEIAALKEAGVTRVHHNLETSRRHFPNVITTHTFDDRCRTVRAAKAAGMSVCSGGIVGMGEDWEDRIDLAFTLRELEVDSVPVNFLNAIEGTRLEEANARFPLTPEACLRVVALFRFIYPEPEIRTAGGREKHLGEWQALMFYAGADASLIGNYLTTYGRPPEEDVALVRDLGLRLKFDDELRPSGARTPPRSALPAHPGPTPRARS
ncbi:MAG: biotin synthase BioB, partial [Planctomycetes bacterium]|nr:biotin synthase BioB [Planctomycetota bacterium]